jgi:hypothetical protein
LWLIPLSTCTAHSFKQFRKEDERTDGLDGDDVLFVFGFLEVEDIVEVVEQLVLGKFAVLVDRFGENTPILVGAPEHQQENLEGKDRRKFSLIRVQESKGDKGYKKVVECQNRQTLCLCIFQFREHKVKIVDEKNDGEDRQERSHFAVVVNVVHLYYRKKLSNDERYIAYTVLNVPQPT